MTGRRRTQPDGDARTTLERWTRAATTAQRVVRRSRIVLLALDGLSVDEIASRLGVSRPTVRLWIARFAHGGVEALRHDAPGRGRRPTIDPAVLRARLRDGNMLDDSGRPLSVRRAAAFLGVSPSAVWRALRRSA